MVTFTPKVVDIYHGENVEGTDCVKGFQKVLNAGVIGVIHKCTQGTSMKDTTYNRRRVAAKKVGLLWGAYHFNNGSDAKRQADFFLKNADPDDETLMVLDFEDNARGNMSIHEAVSFMKIVEDKTGRSCAIYSGNRLKETITSLGRDEKKFITSKKLWICQYGPKVTLPSGFDSWWLHQYTGDGVGPGPHNIDGITTRGIDLNRYEGTDEALRKEWVT